MHLWGSKGRSPSRGGRGASAPRRGSRGAQPLAGTQRGAQPLLQSDHAEAEGGQRAVLEVAALSFIGLGVRPPAAEWGILTSEGAQFIMTGQWWVAVCPGLALLMAVVAFNLAGDALRDLLDPRRR